MKSLGRNPKPTRVRSLVIAATLGAALVVPASSHGAITIGSNLGRAPDNFLGGAPLTVAHNPLPPGIAAAGGTTSPVNGTVTTWRLRVGNSGSPTSLKVLRPTGGNFYQGVSNSATQNPLANQTNTYPTSQPIRIGDEIGVDCCVTNSFYLVANAANLTKFWNPPLANGGTPLPPTDPDIAFELPLNADIEPTSAFEIEKIQKLKNAKLRVTVNLPNPGELVAGDKRSSSTKAGATIAAKKKKKKKKTLLTTTTRVVNAAGETTLTVKATKAARTLLSQKGVSAKSKKKKIAATLRVKFTPTGGSATTETQKTKLKK